MKVSSLPHTMGAEIWVLLVTVAVLAWIYSKWCHRYWSSRGVPSLPSMPFIGHIHKSFIGFSKIWDVQVEVRLML